MTKIEIKTVVESLIDTFLKAGKISIELRKEGLTKQLKEDSTPVSNDDSIVVEVKDIEDENENTNGFHVDVEAEWQRTTKNNKK